MATGARGGKKIFVLFIWISNIDAESASETDEGNKAKESKQSQDA